MDASTHPPLSDMQNIRDRIVGIDTHVPLLDGSTRPYINLDNAASTPVLREVLDTVNHFMAWYSSVHRGAGFKSQVASRAYEEAREAVAQFVGANPREHTVIFGKNSTEALNKLSYRLTLEPDDVVLVSLQEHHSNDLPWRARARVVHIDVDDRGRLDEGHLAHLLQVYAGHVRLLAVTGGANVTGSMPDIHRLAVQAHSVGAQILVDCAQLAPHRAIDMGSLHDPAHLDFIALSAHKMYAPFGTGALIGRRDAFVRGEPEYRGGGTIDFVSVDSVAWASGPDRDEAGTPNVVGAVALAAAIGVLQDIGMEAIAGHEARLTAYALERLAGVPGLRIHGECDPRRCEERLGVIPFHLEGMSHFLVAAVLSTEFGIGVRNGCFCAHPYLAQLLGLGPTETVALRRQLLNGDRSQMPGMVRASFGMYNTVEDIDALADALQAIARGDVRGRYEQDRATGEYHCRQWHADPSDYFSIRRLADRGRASQTGVPAP